MRKIDNIRQGIPVFHLAKSVPEYDHFPCAATVLDEQEKTLIKKRRTGL
jgi:hypothetical protein